MRSVHIAGSPCKVWCLHYLLCEKDVQKMAVGQVE